MALAGGGSRRSKKSRKKRTEEKYYQMDIRPMRKRGGEGFLNARDLAAVKTVRRSIENAKGKKLPSACYSFLKDIENGMDAAERISSKKLREASYNALETQARRGHKFNCY